MVYKYQEEVLKEVDDAMDKIEKMTEEHYRIHIGFRHTNEFDQENIPIYAEINGNNRWTEQTILDEQFDSYSRCPILDHNRVEIKNDIFLEINKLIDKIIKDNKERKEFYEKLNIELKALNKTLETQ